METVKSVVDWCDVRGCGMNRQTSEGFGGGEKTLCDSIKMGTCPYTLWCPNTQNA